MKGLSVSYIYFCIYRDIQQIFFTRLGSLKHFMSLRKINRHIFSLFDKKKNLVFPFNTKFNTREISIFGMITFLQSITTNH